MKSLNQLSVAEIFAAARRRGFRGTASTGLRHLARRLQTSGNRELDFEWNDYLSWLCMGVPGMLERGNVGATAYALSHLPDKTSATVEIGSFCGLSTCIQSYLRTKYGVTNPFFNCDRWEFEGQSLGQKLGDSTNVTHDQFKGFVRDSYLRDVQTFCQGDLPHTIEQFSDDFFQQWQESRETTDVFGRPVKLGGPVGFCYIDGNHTYDFAKRDFENTDRFLVPGGFILFDDSADGTEWEVRQVVAEVLESGKYQLVGKNPNYLVQKKG